MKNDPIIDEVRRIRHEYAQQHNFDLRAIANNLRQHEQQHSDRLTTLPAKPAPKRKSA